MNVLSFEVTTVVYLSLPFAKHLARSSIHYQLLSFQQGQMYQLLLASNPAFHFKHEDRTGKKRKKKKEKHKRKGKKRRHGLPQIPHPPGPTTPPLSAYINSGESSLLELPEGPVRSITDGRSPSPEQEWPVLVPGSATCGIKPTLVKWCAGRNLLSQLALVYPDRIC